MADLIKNNKDQFYPLSLDTRKKIVRAANFYRKTTSLVAIMRLLDESSQIIYFKSEGRHEEAAELMAKKDPQDAAKYLESHRMWEAAAKYLESKSHIHHPCFFGPPRSRQGFLELCMLLLGLLCFFLALQARFRFPCYFSWLSFSYSWNRN